MTREEMRKVENIIYRHMEDQREAARTVLQIRQELHVGEDASRPGYAGSGGGAAYVKKHKGSI